MKRDKQNKRKSLALKAKNKDDTYKEIDSDQEIAIQLRKCKNFLKRKNKGKDGRG